MEETRDELTCGKDISLTELGGHIDRLTYLQDEIDMEGEKECLM